jgi:hypothetical protein
VFHLYEIMNKNYGSSSQHNWSLQKNRHNSRVEYVLNVSGVFNGNGVSEYEGYITLESNVPVDRRVHC